MVPSLYDVFEAPGHGVGIRALPGDLNSLCPCSLPAALAAATGPSLRHSPSNELGLDNRPHRHMPFPIPLQALRWDAK